MSANGYSLGDNTSLIVAATENNLSVAEGLLEAGMDPNISEPALHLSTSAEMTALLLRYKADTQSIDRKGDTPLHVACFNDRSDIVSLLIVNGCDVNAQNKSTGFAPLHVAAFSGHMPSLTLLLSANADSSLLDKYGNTPLHLAVMKNHLEAVSFLASVPRAPLNKRTNDNWTALYRACHNGRPDIVRVLLENNAPFDEVGYYPMGRKEDALVLSALLEFGCPALKLLFNNFSGATERDVDETGRDGMNMKPLHFAAQRGYTKVISLLAAEGANLHAVDAAGWTPLHHSAAMENDASLNRLISLGANVNAVNKEGQTPLHIAADNMCTTSTIEALVQQGCNVYIRDRKGQSALDLFEFELAVRTFENDDNFPEPPPPDVVNRIKLVLATER